MENPQKKGQEELFKKKLSDGLEKESKLIK